MIKRLSGLFPIVVMLLLSLCATSVWAQGGQLSKTEQAQALEATRADLVKQIKAQEDLVAAQKEPNGRKAAEDALAKMRGDLGKLDKQLAELKPGGAAAGGPVLDEDTKKLIDQVEREVKGLTNQLLELQAQINKLPPDPAPGTVATVEATQAMFQRQQWTARLQMVVNQLSAKRAQLADLKGGPKQVYLFDENVKELHPLLLYRGEKMADNPYKLKIGGWGSGKATASEHGVAEGLNSIEVHTEGYYRGARMEFGEQPDIQSYFEKPKLSYLQFDVCFFPKETPGMPGMPGGPGSGSGMTPGMMPGSGGSMPGMMPGMGGSPMPGMMPGMGGSPMPGMMPGSGGSPMPGMMPGSGGSMPGMMPGSGGSMPGMMPGSGGSMPGMMPGMGGSPMPGMMPGSGGSMPGMMPGMGGSPMPGMMPGSGGSMPGMMPGMGGSPMPGMMPGGMMQPGQPFNPESMPSGTMMPGTGGMMPGMQPGMMPGGGMMPGMQPGMMPGGGMMPGMQPGMMPGGGTMPGMPGTSSMPGMPGMPGMAPVSTAPATEMLKIVLETDRGPIAIEDFRFDHTFQINQGWTRVFVPIDEFQNPSERVPTKLKRILLFGDQDDAFYVGMARFITDEQTIRPSFVTFNNATQLSCVAGEQFMLQCSVVAGYSVVDYVWDWGDGKVDHTKVPYAAHIYTSKGDRTVTLTAKDVDGLKADGKATIKMVVYPFSQQMPGMMMPGGGMMPGAPGMMPGGGMPGGMMPGGTMPGGMMPGGFVTN